MASLEALSRVLPILLLVGLGVVVRRRQVLRASTIDDLRRLVLRVTLPAALFLTFLRVSLETQYAWIVLVMFGACVAMLLAGPLVGRVVGVRSPTFPALLTGFEAGMIGYAIYGAVFGQDALYRFGIVDLGQVTFVFFVLLPWLGRRGSITPPTLLATAVAFVRTPVILAIGAGIVGSVLGLGDLLDTSPLGEAVLATLGLVAVMTTPLIGIVLGYSTTLRPGELGAPARTVMIRMTLWIVLALGFNALVIDGILGLDRLFQAAVLTMAILPPPFVIPLGMRQPAAEDEAGHADLTYTVDTLSLATVATLVAFTVVGVIFST